MPLRISAKSKAALLCALHPVASRALLGSSPMRMDHMFDPTPGTPGERDEDELRFTGVVTVSKALRAMDTRACFGRAHEYIAMEREGCILEVLQLIQIPRPKGRDKDEVLSEEDTKQLRLLIYKRNCCGLAFMLAAKVN
eukprot:2350833-Amphidinium_carterae.1